MLNLKTFLKYRDVNEVFEIPKKENRVGLPCIVINKGEKIIIGEPTLDELNFIKS